MKTFGELNQQMNLDRCRQMLHSLSLPVAGKLSEPFNKILDQVKLSPQTALISGIGYIAEKRDKIDYPDMYLGCLLGIAIAACSADPEFTQTVNDAGIHADKVMGPIT